MNDYKVYRRLITLNNGLRVMFRLLKEAGQRRSRPDVPGNARGRRALSKQDVRDVGLVNSWVDHIGLPQKCSRFWPWNLKASF